MEFLDSAPGEMDIMKAKSLNPSRGRQAADNRRYFFCGFVTQLATTTKT